MTMDARFSRTLLLAFTALSLLFASSTVAATWLSYGIEVGTDALALNALPSIEHLTTACDALRDLEGASDEYADFTGEQQRAARKTIADKWRLTDAELTAYLGLPAFPGERDLYDSGVPAALRNVNVV